MTDLKNPANFSFPHAHLSDDEQHALLDLPTQWVRTDDELYELIDEIDSIDTVALDTEFIKRDTYYPILALVQVNTGKGIYLVDAPRLDLTEFWQALCEVPSMVWYACGEDLGIFYLLANNPPLTNVFDVQIGVAYLTGKLQVGYSQAVSEILGVALDKGESQSNWLARPLTPEQELYAVNDVRYLLALHQAVVQALSDKQVLDYVNEDSTLYAKEPYDTQHLSDDKLYLDHVAPTYTRQQLAVLRGLTMWRESLARAVNEPRSFIIGKQSLREIIESLPTNMKDLAHTTLNRSALRRYGAEIIRVIKEAKALPQADMPVKIPVYTSKAKPFRHALDEATDAQARLLNIPSNLLLKGRWINELMYHVYQGLPIDDTHALSGGLQGYRQAWVIGTVLPLLYEHEQSIRDGFDCGAKM
ncbi:HRDC domain-containing protein [Moraxella bovis]|uniref:HRDC domain-containing protein n=1 Tax=Moraxella bovis TaxID=476 RepID=A0AAQ2T1L4_MORBO|nr:HRDC domain-containing protein [Moraxella bovis]AWY20010.1 ribonuclease D [Moraxella bovis]UYZ74846.1 HRDC domain-containing protein [Moraxella bovis]UYZ79226.1 HRDC domain-containing protein [Moraxella bovis]UYZ80194.1 HRDC domain-containing protein [Moraxella bovis]UYZ87706.1 HRDC domain-containing protein [Moraxella bovis]